MDWLTIKARNMRHFQREGRVARRNGLAIADCPYTPAAPKDPTFGFNLAVEWMRGWHSAIS